jgi:diguanylate cyclase (GGDEF)-like protein/PAS domain S-box-containing protein
VLFAVSSFLAYLVLSRPEVILLSTFAYTTWFPAAGLAFAVLLGIGPRYMPLFALASGAAGVFIYHQSLWTWSVLVGAPFGTAVYAYVTHLLRTVMKIDITLAHRRDVLRYLSGALTAAILSTLIGVACLVADQAIPRNEFWRTTLTWYFSDTIALLSVAPFLLIHVLPWVRSEIDAASSDEYGTTREKAVARTANLFEGIELAGQAACFALVLWVTFGDAGPNPHYYLLFLPILWIAMRGGIRGAVSGLFFLNFGIVFALRVTQISAPAFDELGGVLLVVSGAGLILGSVVTERQHAAKELEERTSLLNTLVEHSPFGVSVVARSGEVQLINEAFTRLFQYSSGELIGKRLSRYIVPVSQEPVVRELVQKLESGQSVVKKVDLMRKDGLPVNVSLHALPWFKNGSIEGRYLIYRDISEQVKAAAAAREYEDAMHRWVGELELRTLQITLLNEMSGLLQCAESSQEAYAIASQALEKLFVGTRSGALYVLDASRNAFEAKALWGKTHSVPKEFAPTQCWSVRLRKPHWSERPGQGVACEHLSLSMAATYLCAPLMANGETLGVLHMRREPQTGLVDMEAAQKAQEECGRLAVASATQIALSLTNLRLRDRLREQSIRDPLTGLFNRRFLEEALERELQRARRKNRPLALIFLDIDHFKRFNDDFGHDAGDSVLRSLADLLRAHFRTEDLVCRYGGEEFAVVLPETTLQDALVRAEALRVATRELKPVPRGAPLREMTLSAGIAGFPDHGEDARGLLERADRCLYESKKRGRDRVTMATP